MFSKHSNAFQAFKSPNHLSKASFCQPLNFYFFWAFFWAFSQVFQVKRKSESCGAAAGHHWLVPTEDARKARKPLPALLSMKPIGEICQTAEIRPLVTNRLSSCHSRMDQRTATQQDAKNSQRHVHRLRHHRDVQTPAHQISARRVM